MGSSRRNTVDSIDDVDQASRHSVVFLMFTIVKCLLNRSICYTESHRTFATNSNGNPFCEVGFSADFFLLIFCEAQYTFYQMASEYIT